MYTNNFVKTEDVYPLYMYLLAELYENDVSSLVKIFRLLSDFMIRYRIVAPSGGGGTIRAVIQQLLMKMHNKEIEVKYDDIYFELSNSSTPAGRYPTNDEFKSKLMSSININYARVVLLRIEESEWRNIPVDIKHVTVEHLMPQKLSKWWIDNLGGAELSEVIHEKYINSVGNLTPVSREYNSKMSNRPWREKRESLEKFQFNVTSEISQYDNWNSETIDQRNKLISERACNSVLPPLERTRRFKSTTTTDDFIDGIYAATDLETPMNGTVPRYIIFDDKHVDVVSWKDYFNKICRIVYDIDSDRFDKIVYDNEIHKTTSKKIILIRTRL